MKPIENENINELRGYLKCLQRLCSNGYVFGASCYEANQDVDSLANELVSIWGRGDDYVYCGKAIIDSKELFNEIQSFIFNGILSYKNMPDSKSKEYSKQILLEDINEYYGLASVLLNENGVFHPLLSNDVYVLDIKNKIFEKALYYIVKIESIYVLTHFIKKSGNQK